jgi:hypothetical protein
VIAISRFLDELEGLKSGLNEICDADDQFKMVFYILIMLRSDDCQFLGARFIEECVYIDLFMHND